MGDNWGEYGRNTKGHKLSSSGKKHIGDIYMEIDVLVSMNLEMKIWY